MAAPFVIRQATVVNEGQQYVADVYVENGKIKKIVVGENPDIEAHFNVVPAQGLYLLPGVIDDQVHFREPGWEYKADIFTESRAAVAGGITSYMEMPNTRPPVLTQELLEKKYALAAEKSLANYSFYMGTSNENLKEVLKTDPSRVCGIKIFMGSSTGNMLVNNEKTLHALFAEVPMLIATHCEDESVIQKNHAVFYKKYGPNGFTALHPKIRSAEACLRSSTKAVELARKYGSRLHILHLSTAAETALFTHSSPLKEKKITGEVCIHHLWFSDKDYDKKGNFIKWNPAIKTEKDRDYLLKALLDNRLDVIATDHAPHQREEKTKPYFQAPSGGPMVQHALPVMLELVYQKKISLEKVVEKMCHNPAVLFRIQKRGFIRPGYAADLVLVDLNHRWEINSSNILYKCGWSPLEGVQLHAQVITTFVNGNPVYHRGKIDESIRGDRLLFYAD